MHAYQVLILYFFIFVTNAEAARPKLGSKLMDAGVRVPHVKQKNVPLVTTRKRYKKLKINDCIESMGKKKIFDLNNQNEPLIDVLDDSGVRTGEVLSRKEIHQQGRIHRAVHLYLFDKENNLLLQRRSSNVDHYPEVFSISLTGHVDAGESSSVALYREIKEELSLNPEDMRINFLFSFRQDAIVSPCYIDCQFNDVYACIHNFKIEDISFDSEAIREVKLVPFLEFKKMIDNDEGMLAKIYAREFADVMYFLKNSLYPCHVNQRLDE